VDKYHLIDRALKQYRFYQSYDDLFPDDEYCWADDLLSFFKKKALKEHIGHIDFHSIHATARITWGHMEKPQVPHIDYSWESCLLKDVHANRTGRSLRREFDGFHGTGHMPYTGHLPKTPDGAFIYMWSGPGHGTSCHIKYGQMLLVRGDVVHCGGCPGTISNPYDATKLYNRLHFCFPLVPEDIPPNGIFCKNVDGSLFARDYKY
jgi:hypothetical protein